jgi:hypothetical protein
MAERLATLEKLRAKRNGPQLLIATANAATQHPDAFPDPAAHRRLAEGERIERDKLVELLLPMVPADRLRSRHR